MIIEMKGLKKGIYVFKKGFKGFFSVERIGLRIF